MYDPSNWLFPTRTLFLKVRMVLTEPFSLNFQLTRIFHLLQQHLIPYNLSITLGQCGKMNWKNARSDAAMQYRHSHSTYLGSWGGGIRMGVMFLPPLLSRHSSISIQVVSSSSPSWNPANIRQWDSGAICLQYTHSTAIRVSLLMSGSLFFYCNLIIVQFDCAR
jgi:hypothetical protein